LSSRAKVLNHGEEQRRETTVILPWFRTLGERILDESRRSSRGYANYA
jgi:hypothetical protein